MLAIRHRQRTGEGQFVSTSMIGGNVLAYAEDFNRYENKPPLPSADPEELGWGALHRLYPTSNGWVFLTAPTQENWEQLAVLLDAESMVDDPRFVTSTDRAANDDALAAELLKRLSTRPAREWEKLLLPAGIGCVEVNEQSQAEFSSFDERVREAKLVVPIEHPLFGELYRYAPPATLSETPGAALPGCAFAQHSRSILLEFGRDDDQIEDLVRRGVVKLAE
jgi:crotonobetainyl-CoA:carnitine CoA-transferase CaiB-like acyl-CoA transferase